MSSVGAIEEKKVQDLSTLVLMADKISKLNSSQSGVDITTEFPQLCWVLRDFTLELETNTPQEYLEDCLAESDQKLALNEQELAQIKQRNKVRKLIKSCFTHRNCVAMGRPAIEEKQLQRLTTEEQVRPEFRKEVDDLMRYLMMAAMPKSVNKTYLTGKIFVSYLQEVVDSINSGKLPVVTTSVERFLNAEASSQLSQVQEQCSEELGKLAEYLPINESSLHEKFNTILFAYFEELRNKLEPYADKKSLSNHLQKFIGNMKGELKCLERDNFTQKQRQTDELINQFTSEYRPPKIVSKESLDPKLVQNMKRALQEYFENYNDASKACLDCRPF